MTGGVTAYLSIGSNKGDAVQNLHRAVEILGRTEDIRVEAVSGFYKTAPQNFEDQDWFVNAAVSIETRLSPEALLKTLKGIETTMDPEGKAFRYGPRIIDLDIVLYGDQTVQTQDLAIPHPRMHERCFVLKPLSDINPALVHPGRGKTIQTLLKELTTTEDQAVIPLVREDTT